MRAGIVIAAARGSADEQAKAKVGRVEIDDVAVALGPPAGGEVVAEVAHRPPRSIEISSLSSTGRAKNSALAPASRSSSSSGTPWPVT